jgi:hypothetical protein
MLPCANDDAGTIPRAATLTSASAPRARGRARRPSRVQVPRAPARPHAHRRGGDCGQVECDSRTHLRDRGARRKREETKQPALRTFVQFRASTKLHKTPKPSVCPLRRRLGSATPPAAPTRRRPCFRGRRRGRARWAPPYRCSNVARVGHLCLGCTPTARGAQVASLARASTRRGGRGVCA